MDSPPQEGARKSPCLAGNDAGSPPAPLITLRPLHPEDPLMLKWQLGSGLPSPSEQHWQQHEAGEADHPADGGHLLLSSQHEAEQPWECRIPFSELAREGGMVVGQCPHTADIVLPHSGLSHRHALLEIDENGLVITALSTTHSTIVNGWELSPYDRRFPLTHGTDLHLGEARLRLEYHL